MPEIRDPEDLRGLMPSGIEGRAFRWTRLSPVHIQVADLMAGWAKEIESAFTGGKVEAALYNRHRAYVISSVITAVAFLEASINELYVAVWDRNKHPLTKESLEEMQRPYTRPLFNEETEKLIAEMWELKIPRTASYGVLEKYQVALTLARKEQFDTGAPPYQNAHLLCSLRNALVHYEPEWVRTVQGTWNQWEEERLYRRLPAQLQSKFDLNPLADESVPLFPDRQLSHGCAKWAVESSISFANEFWKRMNVTM